MFTLALFLALTAKPPVVCIHYTGAPCDYTYQTLNQALDEAPVGSALLIAPPDGIVPLERNRVPYDRLLQQIHKEKQELGRHNPHPAKLLPVS